jgi:hypothetical protein
MYGQAGRSRYSASRFRPFFRLACRTFRPPGELIRWRKPWVRFLGIRFG